MPSRFLLDTVDLLVEPLNALVEVLQRIARTLPAFLLCFSKSKKHVAVRELSLHAIVQRPAHVSQAV
jgi:hypothetical protein